MIKEAVVLGLDIIRRERLSADQLKQAVVEKALGLVQSGVRAKTKNSDNCTVFSADDKRHFFRVEVHQGFPSADGQVFFITKLDPGDFAGENLTLVRDSNGLVVSYEDKNRHVSQRWRKFAEDFLGSQVDLGKTEGFWYWINEVSKGHVFSGDLSLKYLAAETKPVLRLVG